MMMMIYSRLSALCINHQYLPTAKFNNRQIYVLHSIFYRGNVHYKIDCVSMEQTHCQRRNQDFIMIIPKIAYGAHLHMWMDSNMQQPHLPRPEFHTPVKLQHFNTTCCGNSPVTTDVRTNGRLCDFS